ncbi:ATP-binding protein [Lysobacter antibioticus]|nr:ATP-binding protein [Lysobacter antibioticus]
MRRFLLGPIIALCMAGAMPRLGLASGSAPLPPVKMVSAGEPEFEYFDRTHGLQSTQLFDIRSDPHGFIWLGGDRGIHRFDGHTFFDLDRDPTRPDTLESRFNYLLAPSNDAVWIVAPNTTLQVLDASTGKLTKLAVRGARLNDIEWLEADAQGRFWYLNPDGVVRVERSGAATRVGPPGLAMTLSPERSRVFVIYPERAIAIDTAAPSKIAQSLALPKQFQGPVNAMTADADGLWVAVDRGIWRIHWASGSAQFVQMPVPMSLTTGLVRANDGALWFGGYDSGLYRYDPERGTLSVAHHDPNDLRSLRPGSITGITLDRSNNLWVAMGGAGLARLRLSQTPPAHYRIKGGLKICSLGEIDRRRLVMGLCPGGIVEVDRQTGEQRPLAASIPLPDRSRAIISDKEGGLWISSLREGLLHWRPDGSTSRYFLKGRENRHLFISGIYVDDRKRVWVSHLRGLALLDREAQELRSVGGDRFYIVNDVSGGPNGSLWLGTVNGLVNFHPDTGRIRRFEHKPNDPTTLSDNDVVQAYTDKDGRLWVATRAGLNRLFTGRDGRPAFKRYGLTEGLPDITASAVTNDAQGGLWVGTYRGIARWDPQTDRFQSYLPADGIPDSDIYPKAMLRSADGSLYLGTWTGLWRIDPQTIRLAAPVPVVLSSYEVGGRATINLQGRNLSPIKAQYSDSHVAFRIAVLGDARRLSYRLDGLEDGWHDMPSDLRVSFYRLPPGHYRLQIRQLQRDGRWGRPELSLPIEITPPLWRTRWAYLLYSIAAIALLVGIGRAFVAWRHRALREQLKESNARLSVALHAAGFGTWAWDVSTDDTELDVHASKILGVPAGAQPAENVFARIHPDDLDHIRDVIAGALRDDVPVAFEFRLADADYDQQCRWIEGHAVPYRRPGKSAYVIGVNRDATQRKRELLELEQSKHDAQLATEAKGRFLAMMSHEIRTPINGVIGMVELLFETPLNQEQQQLLGVCKDSAYVLLTIINDILDFSKIEADKLQLDYTPLSLRRLTESVAESLRGQAAQKGTDLDVFVAADVPRRVLGDRVRVRQILTNLIGNAVKFTEKGGVRVYVSASHAGNGNDGRHPIRFDIIDTGIGMDRRTLDSLFQPFQQADASTTRHFGGTGLGLTIVQHLATLMGGRIECDSAVASGSRFSVIIPMESIGFAERKEHPLPDAYALALCESAERATLLRDLCADIGVPIEVFASLEELLGRIDLAENTGAGSAQRRLILLDKGYVEDLDALLRPLRRQSTAARLPLIVVRADFQRKMPIDEPGITVVSGSPLTSGALLRGMQEALGLASPIVPAVAAEPGADMAAPGNRQAEAQILLAEDNATNRDVITRQLQRLGYGCDVATDGEQAWELLQAQPDRYRLLLTDCHMPRLDGYDLTERIRRAEAASGRPPLNIVAITANALLGEGERCLALGMNAYLAKPLQMPDLKRILERMLPQVGAPAPADASSQPPRTGADFAALAQLVGNDEAKLQRLLGVFADSTLADLEHWHRARDSGDLDTLRKLAHKLKSGYRQLGEDTAASALEALEQHSGAATEFYARADYALLEMQRTLERVQAYRSRVASE